MQILQILSSLERLEQQIADLYHWFSDHFTDDDDASGLFFRMSLQEKSHVSLVRYGRKMVHASPDEFGDVEVDSQLIRELSSEIGNFRGENPQPTLGQALRFAMRVESHAAENIHRTVLIDSNPEVAGVIGNLATADQEHFEILRNFAQSRQEIF